jgi:hypothetical protein
MPLGLHLLSCKRIGTQNSPNDGASALFENFSPTQNFAFVSFHDVTVMHMADPRASFHEWTETFAVSTSLFWYVPVLP